MHNPLVPETLEGWSVLHQMFRVRWGALRNTDAKRVCALAEGAAASLRVASPDDGATALVHLLGHKGDLMLVHFRRTFDDLSAVELAFARAPLFDLLEPSSSYVSIVELGMYDMTAKLHEQLQGRGLKPETDPYERAFDDEMQTQRSRVAVRLFPKVPQRRHVCFYPMDKRRGETRNWYSETFEDRAVMMREHGTIGRHYSGQVIQIISGSIGLDDWEWGVDLFADDPLVFKKLIYEMRFDKASAEYAEFGPFYVGLQFSPDQLGKFLTGETPQLETEQLTPTNEDLRAENAEN
jgi:peroxiredoxin